MERRRSLRPRPSRRRARTPTRRRAPARRVTQRGTDRRGHPRTLRHRRSGDEQYLVASVTYDTPYAARVHENLTARHSPGRKAKFLEGPLQRENGTMTRTHLRSLACASARLSPLPAIQQRNHSAAGLLGVCCGSCQCRGIVVRSASSHGTEQIRRYTALLNQSCLGDTFLCQKLHSPWEKRRLLNSADQARFVPTPTAG